MKFSPKIREAIHDYSLFLNRGYPEKPLLKLIGDRYQLAACDRSLLFRGVFSSENAALQKSRLSETDTLKGRRLWIDGYNQILTVAAYLEGIPVFISNDGYLRDTGELHGAIRKSASFDRSTGLILQTVKEYLLQSAVFYFDRPVSRSAETAIYTASCMRETGVPGGTEVAESADFALLTQNEGILATSDSQIIRKTDLPVFDLARLTLESHFHPSFFQIIPD
jgi:hypothetical protein